MEVIALDSSEPNSGCSSENDTPQTPQLHEPVLDAIKQHVFHVPAGNEAWQRMPELPAGSEILVGEKEADKLPHNHIAGPWQSKNAYLETHYRLLRCEGTESLRFAVNKYKSKFTPRDDEDLCIYTKVRVMGYLMTRMGPMCHISFSTEKAQKKIIWQQSRRLLPGTVLAISTKRDNFRTICMTATVAQRPYHDGLDQNPPQIDIVWGSTSEYVVNPDMELVMIESRSGYYEAVRHTLTGLQMAAGEESPLSKYVVDADKSDVLASFIREKPVLNISGCLSKTARPDTVEWLKGYDVREPLPDVRGQTSLDETQFHALYRMISKELCIVQGPPGTGKTFTSVEALRITLANRKSTDPPIIVAAQTNHALDQLLTLCLDAGAKIVRVGGRTESERIKEHTMYEARQRLGSGAFQQFFKALDARRRAASNDLVDLTERIFHDGLLQPDHLLDADVITKDQYDSLVDEDMELTEAHRPYGPFSLWLGEECIETEVLRNKHNDEKLAGDDDEFNPDEYEFEDGFVHIAEDDEDKDRIHGTYIRFGYKWTGKEPPHLSSSHKRAVRELKKADLYDIPRNMRGAVYQLLFERYIEALKPEFLACFTAYIEASKEVKAYRWLRDINVVKALQVNVVGCTTTGLTKYRGFLAALGARTMLVEEAAETREANIVSALYPSIQQLILVGDHMQLAPFCDIRRLGEKPYYLDMSMFERMVAHTGLPYIMLDKQRRMAPEIRAVMDHFYEGLVDHEVVLKRKPVPGMGNRRTWLFAHNWEDAVDGNHSRFNKEEATMVVNFFAYLVNNGIKHSQITVLTFYKAQRRVILKMLREHHALAASADPYNVHTVDSYQGEENDIVLLSLVRSPAAGRGYAVGFLDNKNRVIVAISRARRGFYMFGNMANATKASVASAEIWNPIWSAFIDQKRYDGVRGLPLECQPHGKTIWIKNTKAWADNTGGCDQRCSFVRECGHPCKFPCHIKPHDKIRCSEKCGKRLACGHVCQIWCKDPCNCLCAAFQAVKTQNEARKLQDRQEMHMDLEELLLAEAGDDKRPEDRQLVPHAVTQAPPPGLATVAEPRRVAHLETEEPRKPVVARGRSGRNLGNAVGQRPKQQQPPRKPAGPMVRSLPHRIQQGVDHPGAEVVGPKFRNFAQNINKHDMANVKARKASLAQTAGQEPKITDTYRPVKLIDGRRVETPSTSPEKETMTIATPAHGVAPLIPELLTDGEACVPKDESPPKKHTPNGRVLTTVRAPFPGKSAPTSVRKQLAHQANGRSPSTNSGPIVSAESTDFSWDLLSSKDTSADANDGFGNGNNGLTEAMLELAGVENKPPPRRQLSVVKEEALYPDMGDWLKTLPVANGDMSVSNTGAKADQMNGDKEDEQERSLIDF